MGGTVSLSVYRRPVVVAALNLYLDDSGTRHPDREVGRQPAHGHDWFAMGGILLRDEDEDVVRAKHASFCAEWAIDYPLHSTEIRASSKNFKWVNTLPPARRGQFMEGLGTLVTSEELTALACVIDRPGYNHRYTARYGRQRWLLCKTAFNVVVERAAKYARSRGCRLRVFVEKSDKETDEMLRSYYDHLRTHGHPFDGDAAAKYAPLTAGELAHTLYDFKTKAKSSPPMQLADLCLWPICMGGYTPTNRAYDALRRAGTLIDSKLEPGEVVERGIKYSCWELARTEKTEARS